LKSPKVFGAVVDPRWRTVCAQCTPVPVVIGNFKKEKCLMIPALYSLWSVTSDLQAPIYPAGHVGTFTYPCEYCAGGRLNHRARCFHLRPFF